MDGTPVSGQQFEYAFDDIGNRKNTGGRASAVSSYTINFLNQITSRGVAGSIDVLGIANPTASVTVNTIPANRQGEYFHYPLSVANSSAQYPDVTVVSTYGATQTTVGKVFVPPATENFGYDSDGNQTSDGRWTCIWDGENRLIEQKRDSDSPTGARQRLTFEYDHQGRRIRKQFYTWVSSAWSEQRDTVYLYDGWNLVAELDGNNSNAKLRTYVWGTDLSGRFHGAGGVGGLLWVNNSQTPINGQAVPTGIQFVAFDGNGNVAGLVAASDSSITARYEYGPFAEPLRTTGPLAKANPIRFSTKVVDDESGLVYYVFRYYNPTTGRWLNRDPIDELGFTLLTTGRQPIPTVDLDDDELEVGPSSRTRRSTELNLYAFVENRPTTEVDPFGLLLGFGYGNWCGYSRSGQDGDPIDAVDAACQKHDNCLATWADACKFKFCNVRFCKDVAKAKCHGDKACKKAKRKILAGCALIVPIPPFIHM